MILGWVRFDWANSSRNWALDSLLYYSVGSVGCCFCFFFVFNISGPAIIFLGCNKSWGDLEILLVDKNTKHTKKNKENGKIGREKGKRKK